MIQINISKIKIKIHYYHNETAKIIHWFDLIKRLSIDHSSLIIQACSPAMNVDNTCNLSSRKIKSASAP